MAHQKCNLSCHPAFSRRLIMGEAAEFFVILELRVTNAITSKEKKYSSSHTHTKARAKVTPRAVRRRKPWYSGVCPLGHKGGNRGQP